IPVDSATNRIKDSGSGATGSYALATYDEAGNQISFNASYFYGYDGFNMMNELKSGSRDDLYVYDGDDERIAVVSLNGATSDDALWSYTFRDLTGKVLRSAEDSVQGGTHHWQWKKDYVYAEGSLFAAVLPQGSGEQRAALRSPAAAPPRSGFPRRRHNPSSTASDACRPAPNLPPSAGPCRSDRGTYSSRAR